MDGWVEEYSNENSLMVPSAPAPVLACSSSSETTLRAPEVMYFLMTPRATSGCARRCRSSAFMACTCRECFMLDLDEGASSSSSEILLRFTM